MLDRSAMLRHAKCCCVSVDTATFIFGVFSAIISGFGTVVFATVRTWFTAITGDQYFDQVWDSDPDVHLAMGDKIYEQRMMDYTAVMISMMFFFFCCLVSFIFAVFLCYGTHKRRAGFVKAYLVYGVVVTILMMVAAILYSWIMEDIVGGSMVLIACGIYSSILLMVQRTYELIRAEQSRNSAQLLCPEPCMKG